MAKKTPNLDSWMRTFKDAGSFAKDIASSTVRGLAPGITTTVDSSVSLMRESKEFVKKSSKQITSLYESKIRGNSDPYKIINSAYDDIRSGGFSLDKLSDSAFESMDAMDESLNSVSIDETDPTSVSMGESKKNMAMLGKVVAEGNVATIEATKNMTTTMANVSIKTSKASTAKMINATLSGFAHTNAYLGGISNRLDMINNNIVTMVNFQNDVIYQTNQAAVNYYAESSEMLKQMGAALVEMKDYIDTQKELETKKKEGSSLFSFKEEGYDGYKDLIKNNFKNSQIGMMLGMAKMGTSMASAAGESPLKMVAEMLAENLIPKKIRNTVKRSDNLFSASLDNLLYRLGDLSTEGKNGITRTLGSILGVKENKAGANINLSNFKKDAMGWNGIAQKTLVEVIPSYLAKIESALTNQEDRYFDMQSGRFMTRSELKEDFSEKASSQMEVGMESFTSMIEELKNNKKISLNDTKEMQETINNLVKNEVLGNSKRSRKDINQEAYNAFKGKVSEDDIRDLLIELNASISNTRRSVDSFNKDMADGYKGSAHRQLFNSKGADSTQYYNTPNLFERKEYITVNGKSVDVRSLDPNSKEYKEWKTQKEDAELLQSKATEISGNVLNKLFGNKKGDKKPSKILSGINSAMNNLYDISAGIDSNVQVDYKSSSFTPPPTNRGPSRPEQATTSDSTPQTTDNTAQTATLGAATSRASKMRSKVSSNIPRNLKKGVYRVTNTTFKDVSNMKQSEIMRNAAESADLFDDEAEEASLDGENPGSNESTLSKLIVSLHDNFLTPIVGGLFGSDGFFKNLFSGEHFKKLKDKLFDKENGIFGGLAVWYEDQMNALKHVFTGKAYKKSTGEEVDASTDSVFDHLTNGYDFVFTNVMKKFFGDDYKEKDTFKKYFNWMDIKGRRERKRQEREGKTEEAAALEGTPLEAATSTSTDTTTTVESPSLIPNIPVADAKKVQSKIETNITDGSAKAGASIAEGGEAVAETLFGDVTDPTTRAAVVAETETKVTSKFKKFLPVGIAAGIGGGLLAGIIGAKGTGLIGSLFLPGGPIGGAILGTGLALASRSEGLKEFLFGKEGEENKKLGLISSKTQNFVKNNMPLIAGGAAVGLLKSIVFGSGGGLAGMLFGGPIAGAAISVGLGLLKNNEKFNEMLFGKKAGEDGDEETSKSFGGLRKAFSKSGDFVKGGLKGLGAGAVTGAVLSQMGVLGAAVSAGGPIGMGVVGLGLGIASQTKKFQELLFGTEEVDEDGNVKGRAGNGLLTKVRNMISINMLEPIKNKVEEAALDIGFWAKKNILYPFFNAFGPIVDQFRNIGKDISDTVKNIFNNLAETVGKALKGTIKKIFSPLTKVLGFMGKAAIGAAKVGLKAAALPITAPLKLLEMATLPMRLRQRNADNRMIGRNFGSILYGAKQATDAQAEAGEFDGPFGGIKKLVGGFKNVKTQVRGAHEAIEDEMSTQGKNTFGWMGNRRRLADDLKTRKEMRKERRKWSKIDDYRRELHKENGYADIDYTDGQLKKIKKRFRKLGLSEGIEDNEQLRLLLKSKDDWKDKFYNKKGDGEPSVGPTNQDGSLKDSPETRSYQEYVMKQLDFVTREFTKLTAKRELEDKKNLSPERVKDLTSHLEEAGISWDDMDIDPSDLVNPGDVDDDNFDEILKDAEENGRFNDGSINYSTSFRKFLRRRKESASDEQADLDQGSDVTPETASDSNASMDETNPTTEVLHDIAEATRASAILDANESSIDAGASTSDVESATGLKLNYRRTKIASAHIKRQEQAARNAAEAAESAKVRAGGTSFQDEEESEAKVSGSLSEDEEIHEETKKSGLGFIKSIGSFLSSESLWKTIGIGSAIAAIFAPNLAEVAGNIWSAVSPVVSSAASAIGSWWSEHGTDFISGMVGNICNNMGFIVDNAIKIGGTVLSTVGKKAVNGIASGLGVEEPFEDESNSKTKIFDTVAEAEEYGRSTGKNVYVDKTGQAKILDGRTDVNSKGEEVRMSDKGFQNATVKHAGRMVFDPLTRKVTASTLKGAGKVVTYIPGKIFKGVGAIASGTINTVKSIAEIRKEYKALKYGTKVVGETGEAVVDAAIDASLDQATIKGSQAVASTVGSEVAEEAGEAILRNADDAARVGTNIIGEAGEAAAKNTELKGIQKFLDKVRSMLKGKLGSFADKIGLSKLKNWIDDIIKKIATRLAASNIGFIKKIGERITKRTAEATAKTAASGSTLFLLDGAFVTLGIINGAINPGYLFGISNSNADWKMRAISAVMQGLLSTSIGAWFDLLLEVFGLVTGMNPKQAAAKFLYKLIASEKEESELEKATNELAAETTKYNKANGTNLTTEAYLEKKNKGSGIFGWIKKNTYDKLKLSDEEWAEKYDYSKYAVSEAEIEAAAAEKAAANGDISGVSYSANQYSSGLGTVTQDQINSYDGSNDLLAGMGPGNKKTRIRATGYGGTMLQSDSRWGNIPIGKFPDGSTSTMSTGGCGPTALAMVANEMGKGADPVNVANYAKNKGYIKDGGATTGLFTEGAKELGLNPKSLNKSTLKESLAEGKPTIISGKSSSAYGPYTEAGHVIKATGLDANGNAIIDDPMRGKTTASLDSLTSGMTHGWEYGSNNAGYGRGSRGAIGYGDNAAVKLDTPPNGVEIKMGYIGDDVGSTWNGQQYFIYKGHRYTQLDVPEGNTIKTYWINEDAVMSEIEDTRQTSVNSTVVLADDMKVAKKVKKKFKGATLNTVDKVKKKIKEGYETDSDNTMKFNMPDFYVGLNQIDLSLMNKYDKTILANPEILLFKYLYDYFVSNKTRFKSSPHSITESEIASILNAHGVGGFFGQNGKVGEYDYKNNFPFFQMKDDRWKDIGWRNSTIGKKGDDISSLAMISSAYGNNMIPPDYIYNNWLAQYPDWWTEKNGLKVNKVFADGGFNAMMSTQIDGKRLRVEEIKNFSTIKSSLQARKPVFLTGYQYDGSIFGGDQNPDETNSLRTLIGVAANETHMALNDPSTKVTDPGIFELDSLKEYIDSEKKKKLVKKAYVVSGPNGEGMEGAVDLSEKTGGQRDYQDISEAKGLLGKFSAIFHNFTAVATHLIDSVVSGDDYRSIFEVNEIEGDGADTTGVGNATLPENEAAEQAADEAASGSSSTTVYADTSTASTSEPLVSAASNGSAISIAPSTGGGNKDLVIGYGKNKKKNNNEAYNNIFSSSSGTSIFDNLSKEISAISYASQVESLGGDYKQGKAEYYATLNGTASTNDQNVDTSAANITGSNTVEKVWNYFTGLGYSEEATAGILGNLYQESGVNPKSIQGNGSGPAAGIAQWENYNTRSGRWKNLYDYAERKGYKWTDLAAQLEFIDEELRGNSAGPYFKYDRVVEGYNIPATTYNAWKQSNDVKQATLQFEKAFERAGKPRLSTRLSAADKYYKLYAGNTVKGIGSLFGKKSRAIGYGASWLQIVQAVKSALADLKLGYSQSRYIGLDVLGTRLDNVRTDCSGFVSACLRLYGAINSNFNSSGFTTSSKLEGFTKGKWTSWDDLQAGDIIAKAGHVEIFAENKDGSHYVYNCGSHSSCNNPNPTRSSKESYTTVWRPNEAGNTASLSLDGTSSTTDNASTTTNSGVSLSSPLDGIFAEISPTEADATNKAFTGFGKGPNDPASWFTNTLGGSVTSDYGQRSSELGNEFHRGLDIGADSGSPILSPIDGTIVSSGTDVAGYGNYAVVQDRNGNNHVFAHMNKPVGYGLGTSVSKNDIIGEVGSTGRSTGSHLHYEIRKSGNKYSAINPNSYKYDSEVSKNLNVMSNNVQNGKGIGAGNKDLSAKEASNKLDIALNTKNVENKLDSLIEVMKMWADRDANTKKIAAQNISQINNTTVAYGSGKKSVKKSSSVSTKADPLTTSLTKIHETLAAK